MKQHIQRRLYLLPVILMATGINYLVAQCGIPTGLTSGNFSGTSAMISWAPVAGADDYRVEIVNAGSGAPDYHYETWVTGTMMQAKGLTPTGTYQFRVRTKCGQTLSAWSSYATFNSGLGEVCMPPQNPYATNIEPAQAKLAWSVMPYATSYNVIVQSVSGSFNHTASLTGNKLLVTALSPDTAYYFYVQAICSSGQSAWSQRKDFTTQAN